MKKCIRLLVMAICKPTAFAIAQQTPLKLSGNVKNANGGVVYLQKFNNKMFDTIDSATVKNGKFKFQTPVQLPELYGLTLDQSESPYFLFLDDKEVHVELDTADRYKQSVTKGSSAQDLFVAYKKERHVNIENFIAQNPSSIVSAYVLYRDYSYRLSPDELRANMDLLDPSLKSTEYVNVLNELVDVLEHVAVGKPAPDFSAQDPDGNTVTLNDQLGKGYVLLDFWAAWCPPCRKENPNVVAAYEKFKDRGFTIVGVSLDKKDDAWKKAIADDDLDWVQLSDLQYWNSVPAKRYGVRAIPSNFLIGPDGTIVAKNLRDKELHEKLEELL